METSNLTLVVGFGNTLRGDDALGATVVELIQERIKGLAAADRLLAVVFRTVHQPDIILAAELSGFRQVVFVDAGKMGPEEGFSWEEIVPQADPSFTSHICSLPALLALTRDLYGIAPVGYLLAVGGVDFNFASGISAPARQNAEKAADYLLEFLRKLSESMS